MNRRIIRLTAWLQLGLTVLLATGCAQTQPFFFNESPDLHHYLDQATAIEYPDVDVASLPDTTQTLEPLTIGNHEYEFWNLTLEEAVSIALSNAKFFITTSGISEIRQNVADQFISGTADQFGSVYDVAITQSTTQSVPLTVDGNGNRVLPRGVLRANQIGGVEDALAEFDAQASGFFDFSNTDRPANSPVAATLAENITAQSAISKRMATGGVATLRHQLAYDRNNLVDIAPTLRNVPSDYTVTIEAQVQHPLMRNRGTMINRIPVVLASLNEDISIAEYEIQVRNLVRDVENAYWDLYVGYRNVATSIVGRNSAIATAQFARLALENGTGTQQELSQAVGQYYGFRRQLEAAIAGSNVLGSDRFGVYGNERRLRELLGISPTDGRLIRPIDEPTLARVNYDWCECVAQTLYLSPELRQTKFRLKQSELELISAKNQILPDVNVSFLYRWVGVGDTLGPPSGSDAVFPEVGSSALQSLTSGNFQEGAIRLEVTPSAFGARRELTRIRGAKLRVVREKANLQEKERLMVSRLSEAVAKTYSHFQQTQTAAQEWQAAEEEVEARLAEFKGGRSQINVVLQSQQRKAQAQIAYYRALTEYNRSINYVDYLKGTMLANNAITLREGPWNQKAYWDALERARERSAGMRLQYGVTRPGVVRTGPLMDV
ncbi:MAG: TolC family protein, partial [Planctomycetota bacterium]